MSLGSKNPVRMDLAAFRLDEVEQPRQGVFRYRASLAARLSRALRPQPDPDTTTTDHFVWHRVEDLLRQR